MVIAYRTASPQAIHGRKGAWQVLDGLENVFRETELLVAREHHAYGLVRHRDRAKGRGGALAGVLGFLALVALDQHAKPDGGVEEDDGEEDDEQDGNDAKVLAEDVGSASE